MQNAKPVSGFVSSTAPVLLAYLVITGRTHHIDTLTTLFWGDLPIAEAKANAQRLLLNLRKLLSIHIVVTRDTVAFNPNAPHSCDVAQFNQILHCDAAANDVASATTAVELYRGDLLAGVQIAASAAFETWLTDERGRLQQLALTAFTNLTLHHGTRGEVGRGLALRYARRILVLDPLREAVHREVMLLLAKGGQHSAALAQYETCCRVLQRDLSRAPMRETTVLYERIRAAAITPRHTLPPSDTQLVSRERELSDLSERIATPNCHVIGIYGVGGVGKTRLALEIGWRCGDQFTNGVYFVALSSLTTFNAMITAIAEGVGCVFNGTASPKNQLLRHLSELEALLILDGAEHLLDNAALVTAQNAATDASLHSHLFDDIFVHAPGVKLLLTTREQMGLPAENTIALQGLPYPRTEAYCVDVASCIAAYPAIRLFVQAAQRANEDYELRQRDLPSVARLCRVLHGLPLAIEMAAAWGSVLLVDEIANEITHNLDFLMADNSPATRAETSAQAEAATQQHILQAVFEYAWLRLTAEDKSAFRKLSVFRGSFTRDAVEQIVGINRHTLLSLVDRSLLHRDGAGRYVMHEMLRQFAQAQLRLQPEEGSSTLQRYAEYYSRFVKARESLLVAPHTATGIGYNGVDYNDKQQKQAAQEIELELDNIAAGWQVALARKQVSAIDNAYEGLHRFYHLRARFHEGYEMFERAALVAQANGTAGSMLASALATRLAYFMFRLDQPVEAQTVAARSLAGLQRLQLPGTSAAYTPNRIDEELALNTQLLGTLTWGTGDFGAAQRLWQQLLDQHQKANNVHEIARAQLNVAILAIENGDLTYAKRLLEQHLQHKRQHNDPRGAALALENLANIALLSDDFAVAQQLRRETLTLFQALNDSAGMTRAQSHLGYVAYLLHDNDAALCALNEALSTARSQRKINIGPVLCNLSLVHGARGEMDACQTHLRNAFGEGRHSHSIGTTLVAIASAAVLAAKHGQAEQSVAWGEWVQQQPASTREIKYRIWQVADRWPHYLSAQAIELAQARGRHCSRDEIVNEVLGWLGSREL